jgi:hypothetical protein
VIAGVLVRIESESGFVTTADAVWWAFLRLSDPGYLGDDTGTYKRIISTALTVLGYVLFMGALIAVMAQWLNNKLNQMEAGITPIAQNEHILILGFTNRTATAVSDILQSRGRLKRFLQRHGRRGVSIVILAEERAADVVQELRDRLGTLWNERRITVRTGSMLRVEHLRRVDYLNASVIVLPGSDVAQDSTLSNDVRVIKALLSITQSNVERRHALPLLVAELVDPTKEAVARSAYGGRLELIASHSVLARIMVQMLRNPGISKPCHELLSHDGQRVYVRECADLAGRRIGAIRTSFPNAIVIGVVRPSNGSFTSELNPAPEYELQTSDRLVLLAESYGDTEFIDVEGLAMQDSPVPLRLQHVEHRRILILGWSDKIALLLAAFAEYKDEFDEYEDEDFEVDILANVDAAQRLQRMIQIAAAFDASKVRHLVGDFTIEAELVALDLASYGAIFVAASEWVGSGEAADARSLLGLLLVEKILARAESRPQLLIELLDPENASLVQDSDVEVIISPLLLSHILAQVTLRRELSVVYDELFGARGADLAFRLPSDYGLGSGSIAFGQIEQTAFRRSEIAVGIGGRAGDCKLNPGRDATFVLDEHTRILVVRTRQ